MTVDIGRQCERATGAGRNADPLNFVQLAQRTTIGLSPQLLNTQRQRLAVKARTTDDDLPALGRIIQVNLLHADRALERGRTMQQRFFHIGLNRGGIVAACQ